MPPNPRLARLSDTGVSVWLDDLSRDRLRSGNLAGLIRTHSVVGVTTNPAIFRAALTTCTAYDEQIRELAAAGADADTVVRALTTDDVRTACDLLADTFHASGGVDGRVSLELDPRLAHDTPATIAQAVELWKLVDRPNLLIKIPATEAGIPAIAAVTGQGISVNVTLIFSRQRYQQVIDAYLDGLDAARATGHDLSTVHSVASFFVSRVDTEIDARLTRIGTPDALALRGKAALANARLAHHTYRQNFTAGTGRWSELAAAGAQPQRPLWASTGVKNLAYPDTLYVTELIAPDTVNTMPEATLHAVAEHAIIPHHPTIADAPEPSQAVFDALTAVGIDLADVFAGLETAGVDAFVAAWTALIDTLTGRLAP